MNKIKWVATAAAVAAFIGFAADPSHAVTIDGTISPGEWAGATTVNIFGTTAIPNGGTAYFRADSSYVYAAYDITGWTATMGANSHGNILGFGVWKANNGYATSPGVEFAQSTVQAALGGTSNSGTLNGLLSAFRINAGAPEAAIPASLLAADSFAAGHRVWELKIPISTMGVSAGDTIYVIGGINYDGKVHWYPHGTNGAFPANYAPLTVSAAAEAVPEPGTWAMLVTGLAALGIYRRRRS
jgi:hypothetical protein